MITRPGDLDRRFGHDPTSTGDAAPDGLDAWLDDLENRLRLSPPDRAAVRDELEQHARERVRDLALRGTGPDEAVRLALAELGDAAVLAARFHHARRRRRRRTMFNLTVAGAALAALGLSVATLTANAPSAPPPSDGRVYEPVASTDLAEIRVGIEDGATFAAFVDAVRERVDTPVFVQWNDLAEAGIQPDTPLPHGFAPVSLPTAFRLVTDQTIGGTGRVEYSVNELFEIGSRDYFDRHDRVLATHSITEVLATTDLSPERIAELLPRIVEPASWIEHGGSAADVQVANGTLFVNAPARIQKAVAWTLEQLAAPPAGERAAAELDRERTAPVLRVHPLSDAPAGEVAARINAALPGAATADERTNTVIVHAEADRGELLTALIDVLDRPAPAEPDARLDPGDEVFVEIRDLTIPGEWYRARRVVEADGTIRLPIVGAVSAAGGDVAAVEETLRTALAERGIVRDPVVTVSTPVDAVPAGSVASGG